MRYFHFHKGSNLKANWLFFFFKTASFQIFELNPFSKKGEISNQLIIYLDSTFCIKWDWRIYFLFTPPLNYFIFKGILWTYISISAMAQKLVLTLLNNEFVFKILNSTPFRLKIRKHFRPKNHKVKFCLIIVEAIKSFIFSTHFSIKTLGPLIYFWQKIWISAWRLLLPF